MDVKDCSKNWHLDKMSLGQDPNTTMESAKNNAIAELSEFLLHGWIKGIYVITV